MQKKQKKVMELVANKQSDGEQSPVMRTVAVTIPANKKIGGNKNDKEVKHL